jgi:hypothetical protein
MVKLNWSGAAQGAGAGGIAGSSFGPWGTAIGAVAGAGAGLFSGSQDENKQLSNLTPEQQSAFRDYIQNWQNSQAGYNKALNQQEQFLDPNSEAYSAFLDPLRREFDQQTIPGLAEQFAGYGAESGALSSSGFGQALGAAGGNLTSQLAQLKAQLMNQASQNLFGQYNQGANQALGARAFENTYQPGRGGFGENALSGVAQGVGRQVGQNLFDKFSQQQFGGGQNTPPVSANQINFGGSGGYTQTSGKQGLPSFLGNR